MKNQALRKSFVVIFASLTVFSVFLASDMVQTVNIQECSFNSIDYLQVPSLSTKMNNPLDINNLTEVENFTDNYMINIFNELPLVGITVSVVSNNTEVFAKGYGYADIENNTIVSANETLFEVASISKLFTWTSLMQLWEDSLIDLDEDVNTYLEGFQVPDTYDKPITVQNLMDHTSGFDTNWAHPIGSEDLELFCERDMPRRVRPPGEYSVYNTYEANLAGMIVEYVSDTPFDEYVNENIFEPLGMNFSSFVASEDIDLRPYRATGYEIIEAESDYDFIPHIIDYHGSLPGGSLSTTAEDLAIFMSTMLQNGTYNGETILENSTVQKMLSISYTDHPQAQGWANGWTEMRYNGRQFFGHGGISFWMRSHALICPEENFGIFISLNTPNGFIVTWDYMLSFFDEFFPDTTIPDPSATPYPNYQTRASKFAGVYIDCERPYKQFTKAVELFGGLYTYEIESTSDGFIQIVNVYPGYNFVETEKNVFYLIDENGTIYTNYTPIIFLTDNTGKILHLIHGNSGFGYDRIPWVLLPGVQQISLITIISIIFLIGIIEIFVLRKEIKSRKAEQDEKMVLGRNSTSIIILANSFFIILTTGMLFLFMPGIFESVLSWGLYPISLYVLLTLPVISATISGAFFVKLTSDIIRNKRIKWKISRIIYLVGYCVLLGFLYLMLFYWRLLGFYL